MTYTKAEQKIVEDFTKLMKSSGDWKPMDTEHGGAWFGGKSHHTLSMYLPMEALKHNHEDIDFLVVGWRT